MPRAWKDGTAATILTEMDAHPVTGSLLLLGYGRESRSALRWGIGGIIRAAGDFFIVIVGM
jgi:hypothetical protein